MKNLLILSVILGVIIGCSPSEITSSSSSSSTSSSSSSFDTDLDSLCASLGGELVYDENGFVVDKHFEKELEGCR